MLARETRPKSARRVSSIAFSFAGKNIFFRPTPTSFPVSAETRRRVSSSAQDAAGGFSIHTFTPACRQARAIAG